MSDLDVKSCYESDSEIDEFEVNLEDSEDMMKKIIEIENRWNSNEILKNKKIYKDIDDKIEENTLNLLGDEDEHFLTSASEISYEEGSSKIYSLNYQTKTTDILPKIDEENDMTLINNDENISKHINKLEVIKKLALSSHVSKEDLDDKIATNEEITMNNLKDEGYASNDNDENNCEDNYKDYISKSKNYNEDTNKTLGHNNNEEQYKEEGILGRIMKLKFSISDLRSNVSDLLKEHKKEVKEIESKIEKLLNSSEQTWSNKEAEIHGYNCSCNQSLSKLFINESRYRGEMYQVNPKLNASKNIMKGIIEQRQKAKREMIINKFKKQLSEIEWSCVDTMATVEGSINKLRPLNQTAQKWSFNQDCALEKSMEFLQSCTSSKISTMDKINDLDGRGDVSIQRYISVTSFP